MKTINHQPSTNNQIFTFGCRLNTLESEVMRGHLAESGEQGVAVFNTCAVTKEAERQARQSIRRYRREHPDHRIIVTGCSAQISPQAYAAMPEVDLVLGNEEKMRKGEFRVESRESSRDGAALDSRLSTLATEKIRVNDIMSVTETAAHLVQGLEGRARAFLQVQNGCNHRCAFCIIPYGRGNSRSVPMGEIVQQARLLVESGYRELVLTGVDMTSYGADLPGKPSLGQMVGRLLNLVPDLPRLRLSSIDVAEVDDDLRHLIAEEPRLMPHLHLSLQAGDNMILKRMKRRHTREQAIAFCGWARSLRPDIAFGADIITGFPTETEAMFSRTLDLVDEAGLQYLHVFPYSEREGTPAAAIPASKQVPKAERKARAARLRAKGEAALAAYLPRFVGKTLEVIVEQNNVGRTEHFCAVELTDVFSPGTVHRVAIAASSKQGLVQAA